MSKETNARRAAKQQRKRETRVRRRKERIQKMLEERAIIDSTVAALSSPDPDEWYVPARKYTEAERARQLQKVMNFGAIGGMRPYDMQQFAKKNYPPTLGQKVMASSIPVVLASDQYSPSLAEIAKSYSLPGVLEVDYRELEQHARALMNQELLHDQDGTDREHVELGDGGPGRPDDSNG